LTSDLTGGYEYSENDIDHKNQGFDFMQYGKIMKQYLSSFSVLFCLSFSTLAVGMSEAPAQKPNIIFFIADNTIIFFFNDHGQTAKGTVYQGGAVNPSLVWRDGGFPCGARSEALISNVDSAPTILDLAGVDYPKNIFDGRSFQGVLDGVQDQGRDSLYFELGYARGVRKGHYKYIAVRYPAYTQAYTLADRQKLLNDYNRTRRGMGLKVVNEGPGKPFSHLCMIPGGGQAEYESTGKYKGYYDPDQLYDLSKDPAEQNNLAKHPAYQAKLSEMRQELQRYLDDLPGTFRL